jgi:PIN domain nuclease of toxin-antitoxin system
MMRLLLDTHIFLWFITGDARLPPVMRAAIVAPDNDVFLSVVSLWEIIITYQLRKLPLPETPGYVHSASADAAPGGGT